MAVSLSGTWRVPGKEISERETPPPFCFFGQAQIRRPALRPNCVKSNAARPKQGEKAQISASPNNSTNYRLKERKFLTVRAAPPQEAIMEVLDPCCGGLDVHKKSITAWVLWAEPKGKVGKEKRRFLTFTPE